MSKLKVALLASPQSNNANNNIHYEQEETKSGQGPTLKQFQQ